MAQCGVGSRRKCEELIRQGRVYVNGAKVTEMGTLVDPDKDEVTLDQKKLRQQNNKIYILLNKPRGIITTAHDPFGRKTVLEHLNWKGDRIYPVGRLDYDTEGLLILTNDGEFAFEMMHPKHRVEKEYYCVVKGFPKPEDVSRLRNGIDIGGFVTSPAEVTFVRRNNDTSIFRIVIKEGKNRQVRRMFDAINHPVIYLRRERIGNLRLGSLRPGEWRYLSNMEINHLKQLSGGITHND